MEQIVVILALFVLQIYFGVSINAVTANEGIIYKMNDPSSEETDLSYSDTELQIQARDRLYQQLRQYGVPADVAQMYVPRRLTVGELLGKDTSSTQHSSADDHRDDNEESSSLFDPWSIVWYIGSFGGLIAFFLVISCSEWCCLKNRAATTAAAAAAAAAAATSVATNTCPHSRVHTTSSSLDTPPPAYHLFAPPSYDDTLVYGDKKPTYDIFVVPVHEVKVARPPEYSTVQISPT